MSRQLEQVAEERQRRRALAIVSAIEFELERSVGLSGRVLLGFSVKGMVEDSLLVLRAMNGEEAEVAFVGGEDLGSALIKACREARKDKLRWRADRYGG